jgi:hypothetical protein
LELTKFGEPTAKQARAGLIDEALEIIVGLWGALQDVRKLSAQGELTQMTEGIRQILVLRGEFDAPKLAA